VPRCKNLESPISSKLYKAGRLVNQIRKLAKDVDGLPHLKLFHPGDNFLLALAEAGKADFLVTGDKSGLLMLASHKCTQIIAARYFTAFFAANAQ